MSVVSLIHKSKESSKRDDVPKEFRSIRNKFLEAKESNTPILIENSAFNLTQSIVVELKYIGNRWCMGETVYHRYGREERVPYTIHYADLYMTDTSKNLPKIIFKGDNPFG